MKQVFKIVIEAILLFVLNVLMFSLIEYYDMESILYVGLPIILLITLLSDNIRDFIVDLRNQQRIVATFITIIITVILYVGAYFMYDIVLNNIDIYYEVIKLLNIKPLLTLIG